MRTLAAPPCLSAAATATAAGAAPPPCQLLGCNGDWARRCRSDSRAEEPGQTCARGTAESRSSGVACCGEGGSLSASPSFSADRRIPGAGARRAAGASPGRRPGRAALGPVGAASLHPPPSPAGCTVGAEGRRRHSQVSRRGTWLGPRMLAELPLSAVPRPRRQRRGGAGARGALAQPGVPLKKTSLGPEALLRRAILKPGFHVPPVPAVDEISFFTWQCVPLPPPHAPLSSAKDVRYPLAFGLRRSVPSSFPGSGIFWGNSGELATVARMTSFCSLWWE